jgi:hypothetical protein
MEIGTAGYWVISVFCFAYLAISCGIITVSIIRSGLTGDISG